MALGEILALAALGLSLVLLVLYGLQSRRVARIESRLKALTVGAGPGADKLSMVDMLSWQANRLETTRQKVEQLGGDVAALQDGLERCVQHVGLVRFNPFADTGGDQSFALALLDAKGNGVVMSSLHTRTATRFYAKPVVGGASSLSLSDEEVKALKQAMETVPEHAAPLAGQ
jgi:hypothetical protein